MLHSSSGYYELCITIIFLLLGLYNGKGEKLNYTKFELLGSSYL